MNDIFPENDKTHKMKTRAIEKYKLQHANFFILEKCKGGIICLSLNALIKNPIYQKLTRVPKNIEVHPFPDHIIHFGSP